MKKLCIDPGHGLGNRKPNIYDPGAVAGGAQEADIALSFAITIKWYFKIRGVDVFLTRDESSDVTPVGKRDDMAEAAGCTHFIAIHLNAGKGTGSEAIYRDAKDKVWGGKVLNAVVGAFGPSWKNRGLKDESATHHAKLGVLNFAGTACLVELGFIDRKSDRETMQRRDTRIAVAEALWNVWLVTPNG